MRAGRRGWFALLVAGAAALGPLMPAGAATTSQAKIVSFTFSPGTIRIGKGDKVVWTNADGTKHTVTSDSQDSAGSFASGDIVKDGTYGHRFQSGGTFTYHCEHHPSMKGTVQVGPAPTTTTSSEPTTTSTAPTEPTTAPPTTDTTSPATTSSTDPPSAPPSTTAEGVSVPSTTSTVPPSTTTSLRVSTTTTTTPGGAGVPPGLPGGSGVPPGMSAPPSSTSTVSLMPPVVTGADMADDGTTPAGESARSDGVVSGGVIDDGPPEPASESAGPSEPVVTILVALLVAVGAFGAWSLFQFRPGKR